MRRAGGRTGGIAGREGEREVEGVREAEMGEVSVREAEGLTQGEDWEQIRAQWRRPEDYLHHPSYRHEYPNFPPRVRTRERSREERSRARSVEIERRRRLSGKEAETIAPEEKSRPWLVPPLPHTTVSHFYRKAQSRQSRKAEKKSAISQRLNTSGESGLDSPQVSRPGSPTSRSKRSTVKTLGAWARNLTKGNRTEVPEAEAEEFPPLSVSNFSKSEEKGDSEDQILRVRSYAEVVLSQLQPVRATSSVDIPPADRRWVTVGVKPCQSNRLQDMELSQVLAEKGLVVEKSTQLTARGLKVPAAKPALLIKNDSKSIFKVKHGQRLGGLPEEEDEETPGGDRQEGPGGDQRRRRRTPDRSGAGAEPRREEDADSWSCGPSRWPGTSWERRHCRPGPWKEQPGSLTGGDSRELTRRWLQTHHSGVSK